jgi:hypothetical protein
MFWSERAWYINPAIAGYVKFSGFYKNWLTRGIPYMAIIIPAWRNESFTEFPFKIYTQPGKGRDSFHVRFNVASKYPKTVWLSIG